MPQLTPEQINQLTNDPSIQATIEANKAKAPARRESDLMMLGYNQALHDCANWPEGHTAQSWNEVIEGQKAKLGIEEGHTKSCICDFPNGATIAQQSEAEGHFNEDGGFCCPHHWNTCGHCHQYDS